MLSRRLLFCLFPVAILGYTHPVCAQGYPHKPIRIVTAEIAGGSDLVARLISDGLSGSLGQQIVVDNRVGVVIPAGIVAKAAPDGYTLLVSGSGLWFVPFMQDNVPYDPVRDFGPITMTNRAPNVLAVHPALPVKSAKDLIALTKAKPGELSYAMTRGTTSHLAGELFKAMAGISIVDVPYKGTGPALTDLIGARVQVAFYAPTSVMPHARAGRIKVLAVTAAVPSVLLPGLPTVAASGLPGYEMESLYGVFAPAKTPVAIINRLNQGIMRVLHRPDIKERFFNAASETVGNTPEQFAGKIKSEMARLGKVIKDAGIRIE